MSVGRLSRELTFDRVPGLVPRALAERADLCVSDAQDLADKLSRDCRRIVASDWYQRLFPTRLSPQRQAAPEFETTAQGCRLATSVGGVLTGRGADIIIIDDPLKPEEALSEAHRRAANEWFDHTLYSRLNDKEQGAIILIMHRLHEDDLAGHVTAQENWDIVRFPAIADGGREARHRDIGGTAHLPRRQGEPLHLARGSGDSSGCWDLGITPAACRGTAFP